MNFISKHMKILIHFYDDYKKKDNNVINDNKYIRKYYILK